MRQGDREPKGLPDFLERLSRKQVHLGPVDFQALQGVLVRQYQDLLVLLGHLVHQVFAGFQTLARTTRAMELGYLAPPDLQGHQALQGSLARQAKKQQLGLLDFEALQGCLGHLVQLGYLQPPDLQGHQAWPGSPARRAIKQHLGPLDFEALQGFPALPYTDLRALLGYLEYQLASTTRALELGCLAPPDLQGHQALQG